MCAFSLCILKKRGFLLLTSKQNTVILKSLFEQIQILKTSLYILIQVH